MTALSSAQSASPAEPASGVELDDLLAELSRLLWKQRELIDVLKYRLEVQELVLAAGRDHRLQAALDEVEVAMDEIRRSERSRDGVVRQCAALLGLSDKASLGDIRQRVDASWADVLGEHQSALLVLVADTERLAGANRERSLRGANEARAVLDAVTGSSTATGYGPSVRGQSRPALLDRRV